MIQLGMGERHDGECKKWGAESIVLRWLIALWGVGWEGN